MKKSFAILAMIIVLPVLAQAINIFGGVQGGLRTVNDSQIKSVYGQGICLFPYLAVNPWKGVIAGAGYEFGYSKSGHIGVYEEDTTLKVSGVEVFAGYQYPLGIITPYALLGLGSFSYKQTVASPAAQKVDTSKMTFFFAAGAKACPFKGLPGLFFNLEVKYVPLSVKPYDESVDLGGVRLTLGAGYSFSF
jgi:opacity protein-like surface antigen